MPELPEVTHFRNYAAATSLQKSIQKIEFPETSLLQSPAEDFKKALQGESFTATIRLGKYLALETSGKAVLIFHFGMTGKLEYYSNQDSPKYSKMIIEFDDHYKLAYTCSRKLGKIYLAESLDAFRKDQGLGPDVLDLAEKEFLQLLQNKTGSIKVLLTNQHIMGGIGNLYADEMLYQCSIHPKTKVNFLSEEKKKELYKQMKQVLNTVIDNEKGKKNLPSNYLIHHRKEGEPCPNCKGEVEKIKVGGRSTYFCPSCQKEQN